MRQLFQVEYSIVESFQGTVANLKKERDSEIISDKVVVISADALRQDMVKTHLGEH